MTTNLPEPSNNEAIWCPPNPYYDEEFALLLERHDETAWKKLLQEVNPQFGDPIAAQVANIMKTRMVGGDVGRLIRKMLTDKAIADSAEGDGPETENFDDDEVELLLSVAIENRDTERVKILLEKGADVNAYCHDHCPLGLAIEKEYPEIVKLLLENGADADGFDLLCATWKGNKDIVAMLLPEKGVDVNAMDITTTDPFMPTPLMDTIERGNIEIMKILIANGANVNASNYDGQTALDVAIEKGNTEIVQLLMKKGATMDKYFTLSSAIYTKNIEMIKMVIDNGAKVNPNFMDDEFLTPLMDACNTGTLEIVKLLLNAGANINDYGDEGQTALDLVERREDKEMMEFLKSKGAKTSSELWYEEEQKRCLSLLSQKSHDRLNKLSEDERKEALDWLTEDMLMNGPLEPLLPVYTPPNQPRTQ